MHGDSFANGTNSNGAGASTCNGPWTAAELQGWDIRPVTHWDFTEGRLPR